MAPLGWVLQFPRKRRLTVWAPLQYSSLALSHSHQGFNGRGLDGDVDRMEVGFLEILHTLHVNVQDTDQVLRLDRLDSSFTERERRRVNAYRVGILL